MLKNERLPTNGAFMFQVLHRSMRSRARVGRIHTAHGVIETPGFVAVGTNGAIKAVDAKMVEQIGVQLMFCNTYHLLVHPGVEVVKNAGGLHAFMGRQGPIITDSGGFQVFSLKYGGVAEELKSKGAPRSRAKTDGHIGSAGVKASLVAQAAGGGCVLKVSEDGVLFRSYRDGSPLFLSPEASIAAQKDLGADMIVAFDELLPYHIDKKYQQRSLDRTHRWEERSLIAHKKRPAGQALYAVVHGGIDEEMRRQSANVLGAMPFDGYGIGGSVGKNRQEMAEMLAFLMPQLPDDKPTHLLGIGDPASLELAVVQGIDTFDSAHPTKAARHGLLLTSRGPVRVQQAANTNRHEPVDPCCSCFTCKHHTVAYLQHLFKARELLFFSLATIHNLQFMVDLMAAYRRAILEDRI